MTELLAKLAKCKTPVQALKVFGVQTNKIKSDSDWAFEPKESRWTVMGRIWEMRYEVLTSTDETVHPAFHAISSAPNENAYMLFRGNARLANFNFPLSKKQQGQWVIAGFDRHDHRFCNAMAVGSFQAMLKLFVSIDRKKLESAYAQLVVSLEPTDLGKLRSALQNAMLDEIDEVEQQHNFTVASIRNRYRNQLNYFASLFDEAQAAIDAKQKAQYSFVLSGYPPSKTYSTYKDTRRSHSRRNLPNVECVIYRQVKKEHHKFARWSVADKVWVIL